MDGITTSHTYRVY